MIQVFSIFAPHHIRVVTNPSPDPNPNSNTNPNPKHMWKRLRCLVQKLREPKI